MTEEVQNTDQKSSYRSIFKATSLFGGLQVYQILISVVKSKFVAILIGPLGVGIQGLYTSALQLIKSLTSMGLTSSAVRDVSEAHGSGDYMRISRTVAILRKLVWITGALGMLVTLFCSRYLSKSSFGDYSHTIAFCILSITLLIDQLALGQQSILQGTRRLKDLAKCSAIGATFGLIISLPIYYFFGVKGIVPTLVLSSVTMLILSWAYSRKLKLDDVVLSYNEVLRGGSTMLKMGIAMSFSSILVYGCTFLLNLFIRKESGTEMVGLYTAGTTIINSYVGMIFTAIGTDYYPKLAASNNDNSKMCGLVNQQGEIAFLILGPLLCICLIFMPLIVQVLYSDRFLGASNFILFAAFGMFFKLCSWLIAFQFVAKGESRLFVINETITNVYFLALNLLGYKLAGLVGLGVAFALSYFIYSVQVFIIAKKRYGFKFKRELLLIMGITLLGITLALIMSRTLDSWKLYVLGSVLLIVMAFYSLSAMNKRMHLVDFILKRK